MQAGTAQKIVLNLFSTAVMIKLGRVYRGLMVNMQARNAKLLRRAEIIVSQIVGCDANDAAQLVQRAEGDVKLAILLGLGWEQSAAHEALLKHQGNLRSVIGESVHEPTGLGPRWPDHLQVRMAADPAEHDGADQEPSV
jgi:N-acetylmuramic acid 6-phosphate etherase